MELLKGKVCVVTGGSRGIGRAIARAYAREGAGVVFTYRSDSKSAQETADELQALGAQVLAVQADAGKEEDIRALSEKIAGRFGKIHVLVNNAGTIGTEYPTRELPVEEFDRVMQVDVRGVFLHIRYLLPLFDPEQVGKIINISSELSLKGRAGYLHYTAAKGAVNAMTRSLALELAPDILVNTLAPGPVETDMILKEMEPEWVEKEKQIPLARLGKPEEIAATAVLLASDYGNFYCGQFLSPNGGGVFH